MLLALAGITGVGKTYYMNKISEELEFDKVRTIRTRKRRENEINSTTGLFMNNEELNLLEKQGKLAYSFEVFGSRYAYLKEDIFSTKNMVFEIHYSTIYDWKKIRPDIKTIYIFPKDINVAKKMILDRNLPKDKEEERIIEIGQHYDRMMKDFELREMFDYIVYNNYDNQSEKEIITLVKEIEKLKKGGSIDFSLYK
mgnify:CR=1 FL=1